MVRAAEPGTVCAANGEDVVVEAVVAMLELEEVDEAFVTVEWARKTAKKLAKNGRLVGMAAVMYLTMVYGGLLKADRRHGLWQMGVPVGS